MKPIIRVAHLIDRHGESFKDCHGCIICSEIKKVREQIDRKPADQFRDLLEKGQDMTKSDIAFLIDHEVRRIDICKALEMNLKEFSEMMQSLGLDVRSMGRQRSLKQGSDLNGPGVLH